MASPLRPRAIPQCSSCLRSYALAAVHDVQPRLSVSMQQTRGKKKMAKSPTIAVRLLKDVPMYGPAGSLVPIARGQMRNAWFPKQVAAYITLTEKRGLRANKVPVERDFTFAAENIPTPESETAHEPDMFGMSNDEILSSSAFQKESRVYNLTPARSVELVQIFVPRTLDFYREPIKKEADSMEEGRSPARESFGSGAAADLLAARVSEAPAAIYGSVSTADVLTAIRAEMAENDEAKQVVLREDDIQFVDLPSTEGSEAEKDRVKHVGTYSITIRIKGTEDQVRKSVRVIEQES